MSVCVVQGRLVERLEQGEELGLPGGDHLTAYLQVTRNIGYKKKKEKKKEKKKN